MWPFHALKLSKGSLKRHRCSCLLYTSDAADEGLGVDLGGRRIIKKKKRGEGWREGVGGGARRQSGSERLFCFFFQAEDGIRDLVRSRGLGDVYKRQFEVSLWVLLL